MMNKVSFSRLFFVGGSLVVAGLGAYFFQPRFHGNEDAANILVTAFSVLAGFLIAVMAVVSDERSLRGKNWRQNAVFASQLRSKLFRHMLLFQGYLAVIALCFVSQLGLPWPSSMQVWVERLAIGLAVVAFLISSRVPIDLMQRQIERLDAVVKQERQSNAAANTPPP